MRTRSSKFTAACLFAGFACLAGSFVLADWQTRHGCYEDYLPDPCLGLNGCDDPERTYYCSNVQQDFTCLRDDYYDCLVTTNLRCGTQYDCATNLPLPQTCRVYGSCIDRERPPDPD